MRISSFRIGWTALLFVSQQVCAQTSENSVSPLMSAFESCLRIVKAAGEFSPSEDWHAIEVPGVTNSERKVYLSSTHPIMMDAFSGLTITDGGDPVLSYYCFIESVDISRGVFSWVPSPVDVGDIWDNLSALSDQDIRDQLRRLQDYLLSSDEYVSNTDPNRFASHGQNLTFYNCGFSQFLTVTVWPDGKIAPSSPWVISVEFSDAQRSDGSIETSKFASENCNSD